MASNAEEGICMPRVDLRATANNVDASGYRASEKEVVLEWQSAR